MEDLNVCRCTYGNSFLELDEEKMPEEHGSESRSVLSDSLPPHGLYRPWDSPGQNTGVGSRFLLQGIFPTQDSNPGVPHCRLILYQQSHQGSPRTLKWVAYPFLGDLPDPGIELGSPALQVDSLPAKLPGKSYINLVTLNKDFQIIWEVSSDDRNLSFEQFLFVFIFH